MLTFLTVLCASSLVTMYFTPQKKKREKGERKGDEAFFCYFKKQDFQEY